MARVLSPLARLWRDGCVALVMTAACGPAPRTLPQSSMLSVRRPAAVMQLSEPLPEPVRPEPRFAHADVWLEPEGAPPVRVAAEVAHTNPLRRRGLMGRRTMAPDAGMLFVFDEPRRQSFWMRNTFLSLDILFIDVDRRVVGFVEHAQPLTEDEQAVEEESQYVLEVHAGFAAEHGITAGTPVRFENVTEE